MSVMWNEPFVSERLIPNGPIPLISWARKECILMPSSTCWAINHLLWDTVLLAP